MKMNISHLKRVLPIGAEVEELLPNEASNEGCLTIYAPKWKAWAANSCNCYCSNYFQDSSPGDSGSRSRAIRDLIEAAKDGLERASANTIHEMGW